MELADSDLVAIAVPSRAYGEVVDGLGRRLGADTAVLSMTKGLDPVSHRRLSELLTPEVGGGAGGGAVGPEPRRGGGPRLPDRVGGGERVDSSWRGPFSDAISSRVLRVYASHDVVGVELCAAAKNVMGLAAGISDGLGFGDNAKAAIITRGMAEMYRLGAAFGAEARTYAGMAGMGDLVATCTSRHSRNRRAGELLAQGVPGGLDRVRDRPGRRGPDDRACAARRWRPSGASSCRSRRRCAASPSTGGIRWTRWPS